MAAVLNDLGIRSNTLLQALNSMLIGNDSHHVTLSQQLHKEVAGGLVAGTSLAEMMRHELAPGGNISNLSNLLDTLDYTLRQTLQIVRDITEDLYPPVLKAFGLKVAMQQLIRNLGESFSGSLVLHLNGDEPTFELARRLNLFHITKLLLKHCVKYAHTTWIEVTYQTRVDCVEISIDHDGDQSLWLVPSINTVIAEARCASLGSRMQVTRVEPSGSSRISVWSSTLDQPKNPE